MMNRPAATPILMNGAANGKIEQDVEVGSPAPIASTEVEDVPALNQTHAPRVQQGDQADHQDAEADQPKSSPPTMPWRLSSTRRP